MILSVKLLAFIKIEAIAKGMSNTSLFLLILDLSKEADGSR